MLAQTWRNVFGCMQIMATKLNAEELMKLLQVALVRVASINVGQGGGGGYPNINGEEVHKYGQWSL